MKASVNTRILIIKLENTLIFILITSISNRLYSRRYNQVTLLNITTSPYKSLDKLSQLKEEKPEFEDQVNRLSKSVEQRIDMNTAKTKIEQYCQTVKANLNKCTLQDRKKALNALDVQIEAIPEKMKIRIAVPLEFITIEQTWGYPLRRAKKRRLKVFAK